MSDFVAIQKYPDGTEKRVICFDGINNGTKALEAIKALIDDAAKQGLYISHIDNGNPIERDTNIALWGMTIENKTGQVGLFTFSPIKK